jgi:probable phosphomutase (TIGR03848 family)
MTPPPTPDATLVLLVRHGQTPTTGKLVPGRAPGLHLAEEGRRQADAVAKRIAELPRIAAVYTSPLDRAQETAERIARGRGLAPQVDADLTECDPGEWTGAALEQLVKQPEWRAVQHHPSGFRFPGGESFMDMQLRVVAAIDRLAARHRSEAIVAVSHAEPIKAVAAHALGLHLDLFQRIAIVPCSVTAIAWGGTRPTVLAVNAVDADLTWMAPKQP